MSDTDRVVSANDQDEQAFGGSLKVPNGGANE